MKQRVLFLCTGNSCRSQMAEALVNHFLGDHWQAFSAGTQPAGFVHPLALAVLEEIGITHRGYSKSAEDLRGQDFDLIVTVCDDAEENCPVWLGQGEKWHINFHDPATAMGSEPERLAVFRQVRDDILARVVEKLKGVRRGD